MAKIIDKQRYKCAMSALQTVQAIDHAIPILHSGPGCAAKLCIEAGTSGHYSVNVFPCTSINEKDVVFGGEKKLRSTIENSFKVLDADLYVVLTGCIPEIIGDNTGEIVEEFQMDGKPIVYASTAGFKSNNYIGHETVLNAVFQQFLEPAEEKIPGLVNIWADVPYMDGYWAGNYRALEDLLRKIGLTPNTIFGFDRGIENIKKIPQAEFNLLVSPWVGLSNVKTLERKFKTPYLHYPTLPIGATETSKFLRAVGEFTGADPSVVEAVIDEGERYFYHYIERFADIFIENRVMAKKFSVIGDAQYALGITKFLVNDVGLVPEKQYVVEDVPKKFQEAIAAEFKELNFGIQAEVSFETDGYKIHQEIKNIDYNGIPLIVGGSWEKDLSEELGAFYLNACWPINQDIIMNKSYVGYEGGLTVFEDLYTLAIRSFNA